MEQILSFIVMHLFIFLIPGPNTALVIRNAMRFGFKTGLLSAVGITCAITLHAAFAMTAANYLVTAFHQYFYYIKIIGALYLLAFGVRLIKNKESDNQGVRSGFFLDLFNPYIALFYLSISPSYVVNQNSVWIFGGLVALLNLCWFSGLSFLAAHCQRLNKARPLELCTGVAMLFFSLYLFLKES